MENWKDLCTEMGAFEDSFFETFKCEVKDISTEKLESYPVTRGREVVFGNWIVTFARMFSSIRDFAVGTGPAWIDLNTAVSEGQKKVIALQDDLLKCKDNQLAAIQSVVKAEVADVQAAVKTEFSSWSEIVKKNSSSTSPSMCPVELKKVIKSAVGEEDRSRNLLIFGKEEKSNEDLSKTVTAIFEDLNENPRIVECRRIGDVQHGKRRPIKIRLSSSDAVHEVLRKAKHLRQSAANSTTYIVRDRTKAEREAHNVLVGEMKLKMKKEPTMYHYFRSGAVFSVTRKDT